MGTGTAAVWEWSQSLPDPDSAADLRAKTFCLSGRELVANLYCPCHLLGPPLGPLAASVQTTWPNCAHPFLKV